MGTRDGVTQLQRRWRPGSESDTRSAIVLVHGLGEHSGCYENTGRYLAEQGHDVVAFDNRGFGQSGGRRGHIDRFDTYLDDVEDLVVERRQSGLPVVLLGHSLGGLIATSYVVAGRPAPDVLVLSAPALEANLPRWKRAAAPLLGRLTPKLFIPTDFEATILTRDPELQPTYAEDDLRVRGSTPRLGEESFQAMRDVAEQLHKITMPTYVLHGGEDELVPPAVSRPLAALPNVTYRLWPELRHECFNEIERLDVLGELTGWLDTVLANIDRSPQRA
ncbi:MAG: lysophospholipase [Acidimicrobiales bacterium]